MADETLNALSFEFDPSNPNEKKVTGVAITREMMEDVAIVVEMSKNSERARRAIFGNTRSRLPFPLLLSDGR